MLSTKFTIQQYSRFYTGFIAGGGGHLGECQIIAKYTTLKDGTCNVSQS